MIAFVALATVGVISLAYRTVFVLVSGSRPLPEGVDRALKFAAPAMLAAMIGASLSPARSNGSETTLAILGALLVGAWIALHTRSIGWTLLAGMAAYWSMAAVGLS